MSVGLSDYPVPLGGPFALVTEMRRRQPLLAGAAIFFLLLVVPTLAALAIDGRTLYGVNVWMKPLKFEVSLALYFGTLAWFAGYLTESWGNRRVVRWFTVAAATAAVFEVGYMIVQSSRGVGSHFNIATPIEAVLYPLMGLGALVISGLSLVYAVVVARGARDDVAPTFRLAVVVGLGLTFILGTGAGIVISMNNSHWVGVGVSNDAGGLPVFGWSRDRGDLRVAHFFGIHAMQVLPIAGWLVARQSPGARWAVWLGAAVLVAVTGYALAEALAGRPFLPFL